MFPDVNEDRTGLKPIDWNKVAEKYPAVALYNPDKLNIIPRDEVMLSLCHDEAGEAVVSNVPLEEICKNLTDAQGSAASDLRKLAKQYIVFRNKNARLPGFGKWVSSMFKNNQEYITMMAKAGQHERTAPKNSIIISCNPVDILRGGLGKHFFTCLGPHKYPHGGYGGAYAAVLPGVLQECAGVAVAFIEDPNSEAYKARCWIHHIEVDGKVAVQLNTPYGNGITEEKLAAIIASKGFDVYNQEWGGKTKYKFINNFKRRIHWDAIEADACGDLIAKAEPIIQKKKAA